MTRLQDAVNNTKGSMPVLGYTMADDHLKNLDERKHNIFRSNCERKKTILLKKLI